MGHRPNGASSRDLTTPHMPEYPRDRFDRVPTDLARVGAHRAPRRAGAGWIAFAWAALATGVLVGAGVFALNIIETRVVAGTGPAASVSATPQPTVDAGIEVVLLNATTTNGLAASAKAMVEGDGWKVTSMANASSTNVKHTTVYYTEAGQAGAAAGLAKSLGVTRTAQSASFAVEGHSRLTVVLGADFSAAA